MGQYSVSKIHSWQFTAAAAAAAPPPIPNNMKRRFYLAELPSFQRWSLFCMGNFSKFHRCVSETEPLLKKIKTRLVTNDYYNVTCKLSTFGTKHLEFRAILSNWIHYCSKLSPDLLIFINLPLVAGIFWPVWCVPEENPAQFSTRRSNVYCDLWNFDSQMFKIFSHPIRILTENTNEKR